MIEKLLGFIQKHNLYAFPVARGRKQPLVADWESKASNDSNQILMWSTVFPDCNWGIACGPSKLIVLDSDTKNGINGPEEILKSGKEIPPTLTVKTPSGGLHRYYKGEGGNRARFVQGNDIRSKGGYVVAPYSSIGNNFYEISRDLAVSPSPVWLQEISKDPREKKEFRDTPMCELDLPENVARGIEYLKNNAPHAEIGSRDTTCFRVACVLRDLGIGVMTGEKLLEEYYSPKVMFDATFTTACMLRKMSLVYRYARDHAGNDTPEGRAEMLSQVFEPVKIESTTRKLCDIGLRFPDREWIVPEWIPAGGACSTLLTGDGGTGKSQLALQLGFALSTGTPWLGFKLKQTPVLYVSCEDDDDELDRRVFSIRKHVGLPIGDAPFWAMTRVGKPSTLAIGDRGRVTPGPFYPELDEILSQLPEGPKVLFLDTAADMFAGSENDRSEVNSFSKVILSKLGIKHHATIILISHPPKANSKGESATYSGSTAWNNAARARVFLRYQDKKKNAYRVLSNEKNNYSEAGKELTLQYSHGVYIPVETVEVFSVLDTAVFEAIQTAEHAGRKLSMRKQSSMFIGNVRITDTNNQVRSNTEIIESVRRLIQAGRVEEINGQPRGNGLTTIVEPEGCPFD